MGQPKEALGSTPERNQALAAQRWPSGLSEGMACSGGTAPYNPPLLPAKSAAPVSTDPHPPSAGIGAIFKPIMAIFCTAPRRLRSPAHFRTVVKPIGSLRPSGVAPISTGMHCFSSSSRASRPQLLSIAALADDAAVQPSFPQRWKS
jgi:hypothetical protein